MTNRHGSTDDAPAAPTPDPAGPLRARPRRRDELACAVVLALAGIAWFGWARTGGRFGVALTVGAAVSLLVGVLAVMLLLRTPGRSTMAEDAAARRVYRITLAAEVVLIWAGLLVLARTGQVAYGPAWTVAVMGAHFLPLARLFAIPALTALGLACVAAAGLALTSGRLGALPPQTVAAGLAGVLLVVTAVTLMARRRPRPS